VADAGIEEVPGDGSEVVVVLSTAPDADTAERLGRVLVEERLAACANLVPGVRSLFRWGGEVRSEGEVLMVFKTRRDRLPHLKQRLPELHPYDLPEILALSVVDGLEAYCRWVMDEATESRE